jgi:hypothetical protein
MWRMIATAALMVGFTAVGQTQTPGNPLLDSGTVIGRPMLRSVGQAIPKAAPQVGNNVGTAPGGQPAQPSNIPPGFQFDLKNVVAPVSPEFLPPALRPAQNQTLYDAAFKKWLEAFGLVKPPEVTTNNFTPGMSRRNRERHKERQWWRD